MDTRYEPLASEPLLDAAPSFDQIRQHRNQLVKDQDDQLDTLADVISRQRDMASAINNEISQQNYLIDDISELAERDTTRISQQSRQVRQLSRYTSGTCMYWMIILALFVAILLVLLV